MLNLGVIGAGLIWKLAHKPILIDERRVRLAAFAAASRTTLEALQLEFPEAAHYSDYRALLQHPALDAVAVLTPITMNETVIIEALRHGKHVFAEKPMALSAEAAQRILEEERRSGKLVLVLEQARYRKELHSVKQLLDDGAIGKIVSYSIIDHSKLDGEAHSHGGFGATTWRAEARFPLGCLFDGGIHTVSDLTYLFGSPRLVFAAGSKLREGFGEYDHISMLLSHTSGIQGSFSHAGFLDGSHNGIFIQGTEGSLSLISGVISIAGKRAEQLRPDTDDSHHRRMWDHCLSRLAGKAVPSYTSLDSFRDIALLDAVNRSLQTALPSSPASPE